MLYICIYAYATVRVVRSSDRERSPGLRTRSESRHTREAARHHMFLPHTRTDSTTQNTTFFYTFTVDTRTPHAAAAYRHLNPVFSHSILSLICSLIDFAVPIFMYAAKRNSFCFLHILPGPLSMQSLLPSFVH